MPAVPVAKPEAVGIDPARLQRAYDLLKEWNDRDKVPAAALCVGSSLVVFFTCTYPANQATSNWTVIPANWQELRQQWEMSHAANALILFAGLCCVSWAALLSRPRG